MPFKAVIFDMDGLMFDTEKIYFKANQQTADRLGLDFTKDFYLQYVGASDKELFNGMYDHFDDDEKVSQFIDQSNADVHDMFASGPIDKKEGLMELLDFLKANGIPCVVASSSEKWLVEEITSRNGVKDYFVDLVGGDEVDRAKPNPDIFLKALEKLGSEKPETLVLEDSLNGVRAAYAAGLPVIMVPDILEPNEEAKEKALAVEANLQEILKYFN